MIRAIPINSNGEQIGEVKSFSDMQWQKMISHFGNKLHWKEIGITIENKPKVVELISEIKPIEVIPEIKPVEIISTKNAKRKK